MSMGIKSGVGYNRKNLLCDWGLVLSVFTDVSDSVDSTFVFSCMTGSCWPVSPARRQR
jgi:hypothetical protein